MTLSGQANQGAYAVLVTRLNPYSNGWPSRGNPYLVIDLSPRIVLIPILMDDPLGVSDSVITTKKSEQS